MTKNIIILFSLCFSLFIPSDRSIADFLYINYWDIGDPANNTRGIDVYDTNAKQIIKNISYYSEIAHFTKNRDGSRIYVSTNKLIYRVLVINTNSNKIIDTIPLEKAPTYLVVNPVLPRLYVSMRDKIVIIDTDTNLLTGVIHDPDDARFMSGPLDVNHDGSRLYYTSSYDGKKHVIDLLDDSHITEIPTKCSPDQSLAHHIQSRLYLIDYSDSSRCWGSWRYFSGKLSIIDTSNNSIISIIPLAYSLSTGRDWGIGLNPEGTRLYIGQLDYYRGGWEQVPVVSVIDTSNNTLIDSFYVPETRNDGFFYWLSYISDIKIDSKGKFAYIAGAGGISIIDLKNNTLVDRIKLDWPRELILINSR